jgi:hypothetical protein
VRPLHGVLTSAAVFPALRRFPRRTWRPSPISVNGNTPREAWAGLGRAATGSPASAAPGTAGRLSVADPPKTHVRTGRWAQASPRLAR